jgi:acyl carrier protein
MNVMTTTELIPEIQRIVNGLLTQKGQSAVTLSAETRFLGGGLAIDSLDLAVLVTELQALTGKDPFAGGFRAFYTVGELAAMYAE